MNPNLITKIKAPDIDGKSSIGTGYPISHEWVITARHVVDFPDRSSAPITLEWSTLLEQVTVTGVELLDNDIALLRCDVPAELGTVTFSPAAKLPPERVGWKSAGYPDVNDCELFDAIGMFGVDLDVAVVSLTLEDTCRLDQWGGMSGAPVFKDNSLCAVVIEHDQRMEKRLIAVSIPWLLNNDANFKKLLGIVQVEQDFSQAITHLDKAREARQALLAYLAHEGFELEDSAVAVVDCLKIMPIDKLLQHIYAVQQQVESQRIRQDLGVLVRWLLPSLYGDSCISSIRQSRGCEAGIIQIPFATDISAEILMASADRRDADFRIIPYEYAPIAKAGKYCLPWFPESGPDDGEQQFQDMTVDLYNRLGKEVDRSAVKRIAEERLFARNKRAPQHLDMPAQRKFLQAWLVGNAKAGRPSFYWLIRKGTNAAVNASLDALVNELKFSYPHIVFLCLTDDDDKHIYETYTVFNQLADTLHNG